MLGQLIIFNYFILSFKDSALAVNMLGPYKLTFVVFVVLTDQYNHVQIKLKTFLMPMDLIHFTCRSVLI